MNLVIRIIVAVLVGVIVAGVLNYFHFLTPQLNGLIGMLAAIATYMGYDGTFPNRRV